MAINLNPGADATLVSVAYRAAMANTPADYSDTLERAADSYEKTMEASSEMWGNVAKIGAKLGGEMVANANERAAYAAKTSTLNPEDAEVLLSELYGIKDAQKELGFLPGVFGSRETKMELAKLKMDQQELFADIDLTAASLKAGTNAVASGAFDTKLAMGEGEIVNAIIKSGLKNRVTGNGNVAKLGRDEYGELAWTLYRENGELADNPNGTNEPVIMNIKQFNKSLATNVDDKGAMASGFEKKNTQIADRGLKSRTGVYDEQMRAMDSNWLDTQLGDKPINLKRAMHMKFGYMKTSFFDDITTNQNEYSADLYNTLVSVTGGKGALSGVIVDGMKDTDGEEGISAQEAMDSDNYQVLTANLLGMKDPEVSKAYFKDYVLKEFEGANNYGHGNKAPVAGSGPDGDGNALDFYSKGKGVKLYNNQVLTGSSAESFYTAIRDGVTFEEKDPISKKNAEYSYKFIDGEGGWYENFQEGDTPKSVQYIGSGSDLASRFTTDQRFRNLQTTIEERVDLKGVTEAKETRLKGDYSTSVRNIDINTMDLDDNDVASEIAKSLPNVRDKSNPKGYAFYTTQIGLSEGLSFESGGGDMGRESITLYQIAEKGEKGSFMGPDGYRIKPAVVNGKIVEIKTGGNLQRKRKAIADIDALFSVPEFNSLMLDKPRPQQINLI